MLNTNDIFYYLNSNKDRLLKEYHLTKLGIFGSVARGDSHNESDIDIMVEFKPETDDIYTLKIKLKKEIQEHFNCSVDVCRLKYIKPIFRNQILSEIKYV